MNNEKGYSLVLVSTFATLLGLSGNLYMLKSQLNSDARKAEIMFSVVDDYTNHVKILLSDYEQCTYNLSGQSMGADVNFSTTPNPFLAYLNTEEVIRPFDDITTVHGPIQVQRLSLQNLVADPTGLPDGEYLTVAYNLNPNNNAGFKILNTRVAKLRLRTVKTGAVITGCYHEDGTFVEDNLRNSCALLTGDPNNFDPVTLQCNGVVEPGISADEVNCGFDVVNIELIDGEFKIVCGQGV